MNSPKLAPARRAAERNAAVRVRVWTEQLVLPTYEPAPPDKNPLFLEKRVYQGSSGKVYPLPVIDRIAEKPTPRQWKAIWIENAFLRVLVLPEIGGRIHRILDKTNGYDLIYYQPVIKPALVGLAGPWISGGIEFNWPQHHRPATFMPVDTEIERHADGSATIWCSDHDPLQRMKGMHGVCLHPGRACVELKVRVYNRTPFAQTFLWWANVATRVHEAYQSFFPPDVYYVADHARRSMSEYPLAQGFYYGVNYGERRRKGIPTSEVPAQFVPPHCAKHFGLRTSNVELPSYSPNDLSFYANIPVPTSYMCMGSQEDFFGGYDYKAQAGIVHIANHHISPGKKQWTWGNHEFGYAWDRNLTDADVGQASSLSLNSGFRSASSQSRVGLASGRPAGNLEYAPYIEIMAGVYTDNQPDFSFLQPGETKAWSQYWYPIQKIGPAQHANLDAAIALRVLDGGGKRSATPLSELPLKAPSPLRSAGALQKARVGVCVTRASPGATIELTANGKKVLFARRDLAPGKPFVTEINLPKGVEETDLLLRVTDRDGHEIISYQPKPRAKGEVPPPATEPPAPGDIVSADELFVTGLHLEQYRHATRCPTLYWREALRRDPGDARCNNALGLWHLKRGEFSEAEAHFRQAIERLTRRNANPADGEPFYNLGLCLRHQADSNAECGARNADLLSSAYAAFYKATWNQAWAGAAYHALAELDCHRGHWAKAVKHLDQSLRLNSENSRARCLRALALGRLAVVGQASRLSPSSKKTESGATPDLLDWWTRHLLGEEMTCDTQTLLDLALDYFRAGFYAEAIELLGARASARFNDSTVEPLAKARGDGRSGRRSGLRSALPADPRDLGTAPLVHYYLGWLRTKLGHDTAALAEFTKAAALPPDYCFPSRLEEIAILETAIAANPADARAPYYLGNLLYDRRRHDDAIRLWERSAKLDPSFSVVWRNLGIGYFNIRRQPAKARAAYERAIRANPNDARLLYERDQLWKRLGEKPAKRLREQERHLDLVRQRDDLSVELCALYNQVGRHADALALVSSRHFQPWEGGEGGPLGQWVRSHLALGREALVRGRADIPVCQCAGLSSPASRSVFARLESRVNWQAGKPALPEALRHFEAALTAPRNLGEARHLLANQSDLHYWLGCALAELGDARQARQHWLAAATFKGDFQAMSVRAFSEMTYYSALAWEKLGRKAKAKTLLHDLLAHAQELQKAEAKIDYFATSLPTMLLFDDDLQFRQETTARFLQAQAHLGLSHRAKGLALLKTVLRRDPNHPLAADLARG